MCGIAGIISSRGPVEDLERRLNGLVRDLHHRGPDDQGIWISQDRRAGLCATRLAILDLSSAGHQPMSSADGRYTIVFNGEIYNYRALRTQLSVKGCQFRSTSDTEVVLQLYVDLGAKCVSRLRGMFAFAIWDSQERSCFIARDPLGVKPLYYFWDDSSGLFLFGSEMKPLLRTGMLPKNLCNRGLFGFFRTGSVPEPFTLVKNLSCLSAGSTIEWCCGNLKVDRYWQFNFSDVDENLRFESEAIAKTREAVLDSVKHHFVSDVPVGIFLSGGIDSTAVLALARASGQSGELRTFSIGTDDTARNEAAIARRTAQHFGTDHAELPLSAKTAKPLFDEFLHAVDQPTVDGFNTFAVSKLAHKAGMKVVLSGLGGDEIFGGYASFNRLPTMMRMGRWARRMPFGRKIASTLAMRSKRNRLRRLGEFLSGPGDLNSAYRTLRGIFTANESNRLVRQYLPDSATIDDEIFDLASIDESDVRNAISKLEAGLYMRNQLLRDSDVLSMAQELELRVPFVDKVLVETLAPIPADIRLQTGKGLLVKAIPELPAWMRHLPKRGFLLPFENWGATDWFPEPNRSKFSGVRMESWYQRWVVLIFETWLQQIT